MRRAFIGIAFAIAFVAALVASAAAPPGAMKAFPPAGLDLVTHQLQIQLWSVGADGNNERLLETLKFEGRMLLERRNPAVNRDGYRQIEFVVKNWEAFAWSEKLDTLITYRLTEGVPQRLSTITAQQRGSDFPARFHFNVTFDAIAYGERFFEEYTGEPDSIEFYEVPPSGNRATSPTLRGFESTRIEMTHPSLGRLRFVPVECNDSSGRTIASFASGTQPKV